MTFGEEKKPRKRQKPGDLVHIPAERCPECDGLLERLTVVSPALLRHGGYGASRLDTTDICVDCRWTLHRSTDEIRP